jgi:multiple sugar transport system substrate-binding protein
MVNIKSTRPLLALLILSLILGACQAEKSSTNDESLHGDLEALDPSGALVVYWHTLTGADEDRLLEMIDDFNTTNEWGITVVGEYQGELKTIYDKVLDGLPTGQLPSLVMTDNSTAAAYAAHDVAVPLSPYFASRNWGFTPTERDDLFPSALASDRLPQFRDQLYSFPSCRSLQVMYYNVDWLKELGFDGPPQTWEGFREMACAASKPIDGLYGFELGMDSSVFNSLLATQDAPLFNTGGTAYTLGGEQGRSVLQFLQNLISDGCITWETEEGHLEDFGAGRILFIIDSTNELANLEHLITEGANFDWALAELPYTIKDPLVAVEGVSTTIVRTTPKEQLAGWLFVKWLGEPEQQARWAQHAGCFPTRRSAFEEMETYLEEHPHFGLASQMLEQKWIAEPGMTAYEACRGEIGRMLYAVTAGESVDQWLTDTLSQCNQALADAME